VLTDWLDGALRGLSAKTGIPAETLSSAVGGELIGALCEAVVDYCTVGWLNKLIQAATGIAATAYAGLGKNVNSRLRAELMEVGTHEITRVIDPKPQEIEELATSLRNLVEAARRGDWRGVLASGLRNPDQYRAAVSLLAQAVKRPSPVVPPPVVTPPPPVTAPPAPAEVGAEVY